MDARFEALESCFNSLIGFANGAGSQDIDREIFHYLGFLIFSGDKIYDLYKIWESNKNKNEFAKKLFLNIQNKIKSIDIRELRYNDKKKEIQQILLLFNLEYIILNKCKYFEFNRFCLEQWSLEHIYAQNSSSIKTQIAKKQNDEIIAWLNEVLRYIDDKDLKNDIEWCISNKDFDRDFFDKIDDYFKNEDSLQSIGNLSLLDKESNSKIGNKIFSKKRLEIQNLAANDKLVPICTEKVFEKVFSKKDNQQKDIFSKNDRQDYLDEIEKYLAKYKEKA